MIPTMETAAMTIMATSAIMRPVRRFLAGGAGGTGLCEYDWVVPLPYPALNDPSVPAGTLPDEAAAPWMGRPWKAGVLPGCPNDWAAVSGCSAAAYGCPKEPPGCQGLPALPSSGILTFLFAGVDPSDQEPLPEAYDGALPYSSGAGAFGLS